MSKQDKIRWIYTSSDNQELNERYNQWAKDYDYDLTQNQPSRGPELSVSFFASYVTKEKRILDAAAGTGIVGKMLTEQGYKDLVAMDLSEGMLEEARRKNVYRELHRMVMGEPEFRRISLLRYIMIQPRCFLIQTMRLCHKELVHYF